MFPPNNDDKAPLPEIAGYRLLRLISRGGMSSVYLAEQIALSRQVAVKVMAPQALSDEVSRRRFENEVRTIARLDHPHVVRIYDLGRTRDGLPFFTMPHLSRGHLGQRNISGDEPRTVVIALALMSALEYAHSRGIVHRDVKAENVLFDDSDRPLLADFGIALRRGYGARVTAAGLAVGSTAYMAPEQARGEEVDGRADLYSLGVLIWELLNGHLPFQANDALSMAVMHAQDPIPKLPQHLRHWQGFMNRALAKRPEQRFQNIAQMREAISKIRPQRITPWLTRVRQSLAAMREGMTPPIIAVALAVLAVGTLILSIGLSRDHQFFTPTPPPPSTTSPTPRRPTDDVAETMMQPLPEAIVQVALENARRQMERRQITTPETGNAYTSVLEAWHADSNSPQVKMMISRLTSALTEELVNNLQAGNDDKAREYFERAQALGQQTGQLSSSAQRTLRDRAGHALQARVTRAAQERNVVDAQRAVTLAREFDLPAHFAASLLAQAQAIKPAATLTRREGKRIGSTEDPRIIARRPVSRAEYARFANSTGRGTTLCRERVSLLRVLSPKDWKQPGFKQGESDPVVCVSLSDAEAYARWYGQQTGRRYRLPTAMEARQSAAEIPGRSLSLWLRDCGRSCELRQVEGSSWRIGELKRTIPASRGYDDVGFRLVRDA